MLLCVFFFFFQAEDGIRDSSVTGVQTCALPISLSFGAGSGRIGDAEAAADGFGAAWRDGQQFAHGGSDQRARTRGTRGRRSEERRVGKEGRSRWSPDH